MGKIGAPDTKWGPKKCFSIDLKLWLGVGMMNVTLNGFKTGKDGSHTKLIRGGRSTKATSNPYDPSTSLSCTQRPFSSNGVMSHLVWRFSGCNVLYNWPLSKYDNLRILVFFLAVEISITKFYEKTSSNE